MKAEVCFQRERLRDYSVEKIDFRRKLLCSDSWNKVFRFQGFAIRHMFNKKFKVKNFEI